MITARTGIVILMIVAFVLVLAALSGEPVTERLDHGCSPPRTMPPSLSQLFQMIASAFTACRTALSLVAAVGFTLLIGGFFLRPSLETRPIAPIRI